MTLLISVRKGISKNFGDKIGMNLNNRKYMYVYKD